MGLASKPNNSVAPVFLVTWRLLVSVRMRRALVTALGIQACALCQPRSGERMQPTAQAVDSLISKENQPRSGERTQPTALAVGVLLGKENQPRRGERRQPRDPPDFVILKAARFADFRISAFCPHAAFVWEGHGFSRCGITPEMRSAPWENGALAPRNAPTINNGLQPLKGAVVLIACSDG